MAIRGRWRHDWVLCKMIHRGMLRLTKTKSSPRNLPLALWAALCKLADGTLPSIMEIQQMADVNDDQKPGDDDEGGEANGAAPDDDGDDDFDGGEAPGPGPGHGPATRVALVLTHLECMRVVAGESLDSIAGLAPPAAATAPPVAPAHQHVHAGATAAPGPEAAPAPAAAAAGRCCLR